MKKFSVTFLAKVDDKNNVLSSCEDSHEKDIHDLITDVIYADSCCHFNDEGNQRLVDRIVGEVGHSLPSGQTAE